MADECNRVFRGEPAVGRKVHPKLVVQHRGVAARAEARGSLRRRAMTLSETLIVAALMGVILVLGGLFVESTRTDLKRRQVWAMLATLDKAVSAYQAATQAWPMVESNPDYLADPIITLLQTQAASHDVLQEIPVVLRMPTKNGESWTVQDAWGHRLHCLTAKSRSVVDREAVVANGGKPIFISANVDGEFYGVKGMAGADNLRSDELPR